MTTDTPAERAVHLVGSLGLRSNGSHFAYCSCGWEGPDRQSTPLAFADGDRHVVDLAPKLSQEVCDNCGSPLVVVRSREGRFCTSRVR